jgi:hypothetical protein
MAQAFADAKLACCLAGDLDRANERNGSHLIAVEVAAIASPHESDCIYSSRLGFSSQVVVDHQVRAPEQKLRRFVAPLGCPDWARLVMRVSFH